MMKRPCAVLSRCAYDVYTPRLLAGIAFKGSAAGIIGMGAAYMIPPRHDRTYSE